MKLTPLQQYSILGLFLFFGLCFLYYQFLIKPINLEINNLQTTLDQKKKDLEEAKKIVAKYVEFKKRADSIQRELEWIQNRIPKSIERSKLLEEISLLQNRSRVLLTNFTIGPPVSGKDVYTEIPISVRLNSDFKGLVDFLYQISISNLIMTARDLTVTAAPISADYPNFTLSAQIVVSGVQAKQ